MTLDQSTKVGRIYANALFEIAREKGLIGTLFQQLQSLGELYESHSEFRRYFTSPKIDRAHKSDAVRKMFAGKVHELVLNLLLVLVKKGRESALNNIVRAFSQFRDEAEDRAHVYVRSAVPMDSAVRAKLLATLKRHVNEIELHETTDESLIGGMIIKIHDFVVDTTIRKQLRLLQRRLIPRGAFSHLD